MDWIGSAKMDPCPTLVEAACGPQSGTFRHSVFSLITVIRRRSQFVLDVISQCM